jgi:hypothetical protein
MDSAVGATVPAEFHTTSTQELANPLTHKKSRYVRPFER